jgi:hypothetical protein
MTILYQITYVSSEFRTFALVLFVLLFLPCCFGLACLFFLCICTVLCFICVFVLAL